MFRSANFNVFSFSMFLLICSISCTQKVDSRGFLKWLDNPDNGLVVTKRSNGFELKVKYLPKEYFASRVALLDSIVLTKTLLDSIAKEYENNIYFLLHLDNDTSKINENADIMFRDIHSYSEYSERIYKYNFSIGDDIELRREGKVYHPVLTSFENHYGLEGGRNLLLVFSPDQHAEDFLKASDLEVVFIEEELGIGTTHFFFKEKDLKDIPELSL